MIGRLLIGCAFAASAVYVWLVFPETDQSGPGVGTLSAITASAETSVPARDYPTFAEGDFYWSKDITAHKDTVIASANRIVRENSRCSKLDPYTASLSGSRSKSGAPVFYFTCQTVSGEYFNVYFEPEADGKEASFAAKRHVREDDAARMCRERAKATAIRPLTVDVSILQGTNYSTNPSGRAEVTLRFTADNASGVQSSYSIRCLFDGSSLIEGTILPV